MGEAILPNMLGGGGGNYKVVTGILGTPISLTEVYQCAICIMLAHKGAGMTHYVGTDGITLAASGTLIVYNGSDQVQLSYDNDGLRYYLYATLTDTSLSFSGELYYISNSAKLTLYNNSAILIFK